jgi:hypothetical protein
MEIAITDIGLLDRHDDVGAAVVPVDRLFHHIQEKLEHIVDVVPVVLKVEMTG